MPATTSQFKIPYPTGGDPVRDAPQTLQDAMQTIERQLALLTLTKLDTPPLSDGVKPGSAGFVIYRQGNLIVLQGALIVDRTISSGNFFAQPLPEEIRPAREIWCTSTQYTAARNLILYPNGHLKTAGSGGSKNLVAGWYELGALSYIIEPTQGEN